MYIVWTCFRKYILFPLGPDTNITNTCDLPGWVIPVIVSLVAIVALIVGLVVAYILWKRKTSSYQTVTPVADAHPRK